jgi:hypothetical protein
MVLIFPVNSRPPLCAHCETTMLGQPERLLTHSTVSRSYLPYG